MLSPDLQAMQGRVTIGLHPEDVRRYPEGATTLEVGRYHEDGTSRMTRRPWLTGWFDRRGDTIAQMLMAHVQVGVPFVDAVSPLLGTITEDVRYHLRYLEPVQKQTAARKSTRETLVDSGLLVSTIRTKA
jgi:hypothetical protein